MIAIGRGDGLYNTIEFLHTRGLSIGLVVTSKAYAEYTRNEDDYATLASKIEADFKLVDRLDTELLQPYIASGQTDVAISANWRFLIAADVIRLFKLGILNCHMGQLPDYKGNAAANWMILQGERFMYVDVHKMDEGLDTGDIISRKEIPLTEESYVGDLWDACNQAMPELFEQAINHLRQDPSYRLCENSPTGLRCFPRLERDHLINWGRSASDVCRLVRASSRPLSGAYTFVDAKKITIWKARAVVMPYPFLAMPGHVLQINKSRGTVLIACGDNALEAEEVEVGGQIMPATDFFKSIRTRCGC